MVFSSIIQNNRPNPKFFEIEGELNTPYGKKKFSDGHAAPFYPKKKGQIFKLQKGDYQKSNSCQMLQK